MIFARRLERILAAASADLAARSYLYGSIDSVMCGLWAWLLALGAAVLGCVAGALSERGA